MSRSKGISAMTLDQALDQLERNDQMIKTLVARIDHYKQANKSLEEELEEEKQYNSYNHEEVVELREIHAVLVGQNRDLCEFVGMESKV